VAWPTLGAYLAATATVLAEGGDIDGWVAYLTGKDELWWDLEEPTEMKPPLRAAPTG